MPRRAALRSDPDLFRLVIRDLYGNEPAVAGRELIQNAVDAVRARRAWEDRVGPGTRTGQLRQLPADVVVTITELGDERCELRVADRGIGMTSEVVVDYYLQAGASFGLTTAEVAELDRGAAVRTMKSGRFGIGAFAAFLLGPELQLTTRHASAARGLSFRARIDDDLVQINWAEAPVGTEVIVPFDAAALPSRSRSNEPQTPQELLQTIAGYYRLRDPGIQFVHQTLDAGLQEMTGPGDVPTPGRRLPDHWREARSEGFEGVLWSIPKRSGDRWDHGFDQSNTAALAHNGIMIRKRINPLVIDADGIAMDSIYQWSDAAHRDLMRRPSIAVFDSRHILGVALHRYYLVDPTLPFEDGLLESIGADIVAHALVAGARSHPLQDGLGYSPVVSGPDWMPLLPSVLRSCLKGPLLVFWRFPDEGVKTGSPWVPPQRVSLVAFGSESSVLSWQQFAHRAAFTLDRSHRAAGEGSSIQRGVVERENWALLPGWVANAVTAWERRLCARAVATVVMRGDPPPADSVPTVATGHPGWRSFGYTSRESPGLFMAGDRAVDRHCERNLINAAETLRSDGHFTAPSFALSIFEDFEPQTPANDQLASAWLRIVGAGLPREPHKREAAAKVILADNRVLSPLVNKWGRILADRPPHRRTARSTDLASFPELGETDRA